MSFSETTLVDGLEQNHGNLSRIEYLAQDCCNSSASALELPQSYGKLSIFPYPMLTGVWGLI